MKYANLFLVAIYVRPWIFEFSNVDYRLRVLHGLRKKLLSTNKKQRGHYFRVNL